MATVALAGVTGTFPIGTLVGAYPEGQGNRVAGQLSATATVAGDGSLTFTGLGAGTYVAFARVAGADVYAWFTSSSTSLSTTDPGLSTASVSVGSSVVILTQAAYDALGVKDATKLYVIVG